MIAAYTVAAVGARAVETAGAYAGLAAIVGLGVLSLLYFSQAREVKRLREWAGRAPERALELEQRVQADAQRRVVAQPLAPATIAAQKDAARQAAAAGEPSAKLPPPPPAPAPLVGPPGQLARPSTPSAAGTPAPAPGVTAPALGSVPKAPTPAAPAVPDAPAATAAPGAAPAAASGGTATSTSKPTTAAATAAAARQAVLASRSVSPGPTGNGAGQETHESEAARPSPLPVLPKAPADDDRGGFSAARIGAIVGGAIVVVLIAVVAVLTLTGGDSKPKPNDFGTSTQAAPVQTSPGGFPSGSGSTARVDRRAVKVAVLNGTGQTGLARGVADKLEQSGFTIGAVGNSDKRQVPQTVISYTAGNEQAAQTVAGLIKVDRGSVQAIDKNPSLAADADVVVTVGTNQIG